MSDPSAALHEAAHAVVALLVGAQVHHLQLTPKPGCMISLPKPPRPEDLEARRLHLLGNLCVSMAGHLAECMADPHRDLPLDKSEGSDYERAQQYLMRHGDPRFNGAIVDEAIAETRRLLKSYWPCIEEIARMLSRRGRVEDRELLAVYKRYEVSTG